MEWVGGEEQFGDKYSEVMQFLEYLLTDLVNFRFSRRLLILHEYAFCLYNHRTVGQEKLRLEVVLPCHVD